MSADLETGIDFSALGCKIVTGVLVVVVVVVVEVVDEVVEGGVFTTTVGYRFFFAEVIGVNKAYLGHIKSSTCDRISRVLAWKCVVGAS